MTAQRKLSRLPVPTESAEQICLFRWAAFQSGAHPELKWLYHIPNGGKRCAATAGRLKAEGVKSGVPDLCLPVPRGGYHGLYIELKRERGGSTSENQAAWLRFLARQGYATAVCNGWEAAGKTLLDYLAKQGGEKIMASETENARLMQENERLHELMRLAAEDMRLNDNCDICEFKDSQPYCDCDCLDCELECMCRSCSDESNFKWRHADKLKGLVDL